MKLYVKLHRDTVLLKFYNLIYIYVVLLDLTVTDEFRRSNERDDIISESTRYIYLHNHHPQKI